MTSLESERILWILSLLKTVRIYVHRLIAKKFSLLTPSLSIIQDVCAQTVADGNSCEVVDGQMTFYTTKQYELNDPDGPHLPGCGNILIILIEKMDESILVNSHEDIVRVSYFDAPINTTNSTGLEDFCTVNTFEPSSMPSPAPSVL